MTKTKAVLAWIALGGAVETTVIITNWDEAKTSLKSMYVLDGVPVAEPVDDLETRSRRFGLKTSKNAAVPPSYRPFDSCELAPEEWH